MQIQYKQVAVLMGGYSAEREVSLNSGRAVVDALRGKGYPVTPIDVTGPYFALLPNIDVVFIALHGEFGEDGQVQRMLDERGIPYTGPGAEASALAFDKQASKERFLAAGLPTPAYEIKKVGDARTLPLPVVVKPIRQGSSVGIHRVRVAEEWDAALADACQYGGQALVEAYIPGVELTVGVVGDEILPVLEIRAPEGYYDYRAKYTKGVTEYLVPAPIPDVQAEQCRAYAARACEVLGIRGMSRVDFRMNPEGELYILEVNAIPGFTETSLLPKAARAAGMEFPDLCDRILSMARVG